ncbi:MAG: hypothetical protein KTR25_15635 [Myxococcales bacterium]|nr:hypothetical protein [Myxococcales bacterium]
MKEFEEMSGRCAHVKSQLQLRRHFERVDETVGTQMWLHISECEQCRKLYERYANAERGMYSDASSLTPAAIDRIEMAVMARHCAPDVSPGSARRPLKMSFMRNLGLGTIVAGGALSLSLLLGPSEEIGTFQTRGEGGPSSVTETMLQGFRVLAINSPEHTAPSVRELANDGHVSIEDRLVFLVTTQGPDVVHIVVHLNGEERTIQTATVGGGANLRTGPSIAVPDGWLGRTVRLLAVAGEQQPLGKPISLGIEVKK